MPGAQPLSQSPFPTSPARNADMNSSARVGFAFGLSAAADRNVQDVQSRAGPGSNCGVESVSLVG